jgi:hypothetical protein
LFTSIIEAMVTPRKTSSDINLPTPGAAAGDKLGSLTRATLGGLPGQWNLFQDPDGKTGRDWILRR